MTDIAQLGAEPLGVGGCFGIKNEDNNRALQSLSTEPCQRSPVCSFGLIVGTTAAPYPHNRFYPGDKGGDSARAKGQRPPSTVLNCFELILVKTTIIFIFLFLFAEKVREVLRYVTHDVWNRPTCTPTYIRKPNFRRVLLHMIVGIRTKTREHSALQSSKSAPPNIRTAISA